MNLAEIAAKSVHQRRLGTLGSTLGTDGMEGYSETLEALQNWLLTKQICSAVHLTEINRKPLKNLHIFFQKVHVTAPCSH